jgi:DNA-binding NtrC family response regulator
VCSSDLEKTLVSAKGPDQRPFEVKATGDYASGLSLLGQERFDVVVTDMFMGEEDEGLGILRALTEKSPITIVLTAYPRIPNCVQAMRAGAWDYIEKTPEDGSDPYENLLKSIREACERRREQPETGKAAGDTRWVHENIGKLIEQYPGQVVAVLDQKVVDSDKSLAALSNRIREKYPLARPSLVSIPDKNAKAI